MRTIRRGIVAAVLTVTSIVGVTSAASAQGAPYDMLSLESAAMPMAAAGIPDTTVGYRFDSEAVVVVVPDTLNVDDATLRTIDQVVWNTEPFRFKRLEVWRSDWMRMLHRQSYAELRRTLGKRPAGLPQQSLREFGDSLDRLASYETDGAFKWIVTAAFAAVVGTITIMLVVVLFVLVSAQWRRAQADAKL